MAFAPTRSGKGVGLVVPTLLSWTGSAVVHDIKGGRAKALTHDARQFSRNASPGSARRSSAACR